MENWSEALHAASNHRHDMEDVMIVGAVISISGGRLVQSRAARDRFRRLTEKVEESALSLCNISSIASATGMQRETVRRRVKRLVDAGILMNDDNRGIVIPYELQQAQNVNQTLWNQIQSVIRFVEHLERLQIVRLTS